MSPTSRSRELLQKWGPRLGYPLFYLVSLALFLVLTFPFDKLRDRVVATFNAQQKSSAAPQRLAIESLGSHWLTGVKAKGVRLTSPSSDPAMPDTKIVLDEVRASVSIMGLMVGTKDVAFGIDAFGGTVKGTYVESAKERKVDVTLEGVDLSKVDAIASAAGFPLEGKLDGAINFLLPEGKASKASGKVKLDVRDMLAGTATELKVKTPLGPFTLPRLKVGTFTIEGEAKDGVLKLSKVGASGGDVDVTGDGRVQLRENANDAGLDVAVRFKINDAYRNKNDRTKMLFGTPGGKEKPMLEMDPRMAKAKNAEGFYGLTVKGTLGRPDVQPAGGSATIMPSLGSGGASGSSFK
jgi:type II secretion system protein N